MITPPLIEVRQLTKIFGNVTAVDNLSFEVAPGEILGLLGANGAGKTTTIQMLLGLTSPTSGTIRIFDKDLARCRREILARVNFSSAYISLPTNLTARENLTVFAGLYGIRRPHRKIQELLELFEIPHVLDVVTGTLSSGQVTRLNLCKALLNDPEVLFLDEPTASLDPDIADKVRETLSRIQRERNLTMLYTSHNMQEISRLCNRVIFMARGRAVMEGEPDEIVTRAKAESLEDVFISIARDGVIRSVDESQEAE